MKQMYSNEPGFRNAVLSLQQRNNTTIIYMRAKTIALHIWHNIYNLLMNQMKQDEKVNGFNNVFCLHGHATTNQRTDQRNGQYRKSACMGACRL